MADLLTPSGDSCGNLRRKGNKNLLFARKNTSGRVPGAEAAGATDESSNFGRETVWLLRSCLGGFTAALWANHCYREKIRNRRSGFSVHCENAGRGTAQLLREAIIDGVQIGEVYTNHRGSIHACVKKIAPSSNLPNHQNQQNMFIHDPGRRSCLPGEKQGDAHYQQKSATTLFFASTFRFYITARPLESLWEIDSAHKNPAYCPAGLVYTSDMQRFA
ncbi:MAG: hypothetical protein ACRD41_11035 [Candidatus Acidiferrales bacterium]